jgi:hypothetical protein
MEILIIKHFPFHHMAGSLIPKMIEAGVIILLVALLLGCGHAFICRKNTRHQESNPVNEH